MAALDSEVNQTVEQLPDAEKLHPMRQVGVLASGEGTTFQAFFDAIEFGNLDAQVNVLLTDNPLALVVQRANRLDVNAVLVDQADGSGMLHHLQQFEVGSVVSLGYRRLILPETVRAYAGRIFNSHPGPLPLTEGFYGVGVQEKVLSSGAEFSGPSFHLVNEGLDTGAVIAHEPVPVWPGDTPGTLKERVQKVERPFVVETYRRILSGELVVPDAI